MSTGHDEVTANPQEERVLAHLKGVRLERAGKGRLLLTNKRLEFDTKGGFFSPARLEFSVPLTMIVSAAEGDNVANSLVVKWLDENSQRVVSRLNLPKGDATVNLCRCLNRSLESLRVEAEQQERRARCQTFLWQTSYNVWVMVGLLLQVVMDLTHEDWDAVDASLSEVAETASALAVQVSADVANQIQALVEAVPSRDAPAVLREAVASLKTLGTSLNNELGPAEEWGELALEDSPGPKWRDIRYVFLFAGTYKLLTVWQEAREIEKVKECLLRLARLSSIVARAVCLESKPASSSQEEDASSTIEASAQDIETLLKVNAGLA